jgi:hypothetical protein
LQEGKGREGNKGVEGEREVMFDKFWSAYPRKVAKEDARRAWNKLALPFTEFEKLMAALSAAKVTWTEERFIPYPATWINGRRWEDELVPSYQPSGEIV